MWCVYTERRNHRCIRVLVCVCVYECVCESFCCVTFTSQCLLMVTNVATMVTVSSRNCRVEFHELAHNRLINMYRKNIYNQVGTLNKKNNTNIQLDPSKKKNAFIWSTERYLFIKFYRLDSIIFDLSTEVMNNPSDVFL